MELSPNGIIIWGYYVLAPTLMSSCDFTPAFVIVVILPLFFENEA